MRSQTTTMLSPDFSKLQVRRNSPSSTFGGDDH